VTERMRSVMNDPSFAYGHVYQPVDILEKSITMLQTRLAKQQPETLTMEYLDSQYSELFKMLVDNGFCIVAAYTSPSISKDIWLRHQLRRIERYRD
jgi:hypothetical protein